MEISIYILISFIFLIMLSAFFSGTETAYFNLKTHRDNVPSKLKDLLDNPRRLLVSILTGNTIVNVGIGSLAAIITYRISPDNQNLMLLQVIVVSIVLIIFGEILPKTIAMRSSSQFANIVYYPLRVFMILLHPITLILNGINKFVLKLIPKEEKSFDTEEELEILAELGEEKGSLEEEESDMIRSIIKFDDKTVREVMTPRVDILSLPSDASIDDAMDLIAKKQFSKIPLYRENIDEITGIIYAKDLVPYLIGSRPNVKLQSISRNVYFVPEQKPIDDLLNDFKEKKISLAIVVDEWGGTSGMVTLEDIVEEVMGEIRDPYDLEKSPVSQINNENFIVDGKISIYDLEEEIEGMSFPEDRDYDTLGGLILDNLEDIPKQGESVVHDEWMIKVLDLDGNRITKVQITKIS
ncbi:MAG: metal transporter [Candidatus Marinimicrobia bacterium]|nr:metal transporter [Candidatus Neomarinimicrobiota bacterium]